MDDKPDTLEESVTRTDDEGDDDPARKVSAPLPPGRLSLAERLKRGGVEFAAIFLAVFLSFLAEDWREDLGDQEEGVRMLRGILADIDQELATIDGTAFLDSLATESGLWLHRNWERDALPEDSVSSTLAALHSGPLYSPVRTEYESAKYAGRLQYVDDPDLRQEITALYEQSQPELVRAYEIRAEFVLEFWRLLRPYEIYGTDFVGGRVVPRASFGVPWAEVRQDAALRSALVESIGFRRFFYRQLRSYDEQSIALRESILEFVEES